jgi:transposase
MANATRQIPAVAGPAHDHFRKWRELNLLQRLCDRIRRAARVAAGRDPSPSAAVIHTQSARAERQGGPGWGRDPNKQVTGRKRHVIVDTLGLLLAVVVHPANENDAQSAPSVLKQLLGKVPRLRVIFADRRVHLRVIFADRRVQEPPRGAPLAVLSLASFGRRARWG